MSSIVNLLSWIGVRVAMRLSGLAAFFQLIGIAVTSLAGGWESGKQQLLAKVTAPAGQLLAFRVLRAFWPNLLLRRSFITAYENSATAVVTRASDVREVLLRDADFEVVYEPRMREITAGENFFLGMQNSPEYQRDVSNMRIAVRRSDVADIVVPFARRKAAEFIAAAAGRIDVPQDLTLRIPAQLMGEYFGTPGPSEREMIAWTTVMFWFLFGDLTSNPAVGARARDAAAACRAYLDATIAARRATPVHRDDVLNRCLAMQGLPAMDDLAIRNNLIGLLIGAVPTLSKAAVLALDQLLDRPEALAGAQRAASAGDDALLAAHIFEALRFNPLNPLIYRRAVRDATIARATLRACTIPQGTMVLACNLSAMFDPLQVASPGVFRTDRPWYDYMLWGFGLHDCFGAAINRAIIPAMLKPLLQQPGLRRAAGASGQIDTAGTPFPAHFVLEFG